MTHRSTIKVTANQLEPGYHPELMMFGISSLLIGWNVSAKYKRWITEYDDEATGDYYPAYWSILELDGFAGQEPSGRVVVHLNVNNSFTKLHWHAETDASTRLKESDIPTIVKAAIKTHYSK